MERINPYRSHWNDNDKDVGNDALHIILTQTILPRLVTPFGYLVLAGVTAWLAQKVGHQVWPTDFYEREGYYHDLVKKGELRIKNEKLKIKNTLDVHVI